MFLTSDPLAYIHFVSFHFILYFNTYILSVRFKKEKEYVVKIIKKKNGKWSKIAALPRSCVGSCRF